MHFLRSLYTQNLQKEKFNLRRLKKIPNPNRPSQAEINSARNILRLAGDKLDMTKHLKEREIIRQGRKPRLVEILDTTY